ncbi:TRL-like family protein [Leptospira dzoumogneensis]|uniref:TRL-like family protein n=1 Tax=Leptospira dzoumogneensis TaxID=2484904 RepID=UPI001FCB8D69|nr:TRL-like family protein [Leptospira dzoumogneensis]
MNRILFSILLVLSFETCKGIIYRQEKIPGKIGNVEGIKSAKVCVYNFLFLVSAGDASITEAKRQGEISRIHSVEIEVSSFLFIFVRRHCLILTGD